jgi:hypothetical protein
MLIASQGPNHPTKEEKYYKKNFFSMTHKIDENRSTDLLI